MEGIPAVAYYRMSTDRQEDSIDRQRSQVEPYAKKNGYRIIRDYLDEGIAGDEEHKRKAFMRMLQDATGKQFRVILCDDKDRFGRFDSISYGYYVKPLRDIGVELVTVAQGRTDWGSFIGRITDAILQEAKKIESQATSRRVITRMLLMARQGKWLGGVAPYGYRVERDPGVGKRLVPGDPQKVEAVKLMFRLYATGSSLDDIVKALVDRKIPGPRGGKDWNKTTARAILRNRKYVGDFCWNAGHDGKYSAFSEGNVTTSDAKTPKRTNPVEDWIVLPDTHEALIERSLYEKVQVRLAQNKVNTSPAKGKPYLLSGLLVCGNCGWRMFGGTMSGKRFYHCGRYHHMGKHGCTANYVMEAKVLSCIAKKLKQVLLSPKNLKKLRQEMRRQEAAVANGEVIAPGRLHRQIQDLTKKIDQGIDRLATIDADLLDDFKVRIRAWKQEKTVLEAEMARLMQPVEKTDVEAIIRAVEAKLNDFEEAIQDGQPALVKEFLREMVSKVELYFARLPRRGKIRNPFRKGIIFLRPQADLDLSSVLCNEANPTLGG